MDIKKAYELWCEKATADADLIKELNEMNDAQIEDAFYRDLAFGTGGLRGVIGAGTNRMNVYTVAKASQGLADYVNKHAASGKGSIAVSYDSRIKSDLFSYGCSSLCGKRHHGASLSAANADTAPFLCGACAEL